MSKYFKAYRIDENDLLERLERSNKKKQEKMKNISLLFDIQFKKKKKNSI